MEPLGLAKVCDNPNIALFVKMKTASWLSSGDLERDTAMSPTHIDLVPIL